MADTTLYDTMAPSVGSVALAHQKLLRMKVGGVFINITGDLNNLQFNPTKITVPREVYGQKGRPAEDVIGYSYAPSFDVEVVRDRGEESREHELGGAHDEDRQGKGIEGERHRVLRGEREGVASRHHGQRPGHRRAPADRTDEGISGSRG